jgi:hypothetical protein
MKLKILGLALLAFAATCAYSQGNKIPSRAELHKIMNDAVKQFNSKMTNTRVDEMTVIRMLTYDEATPTMSYHYATTYFAKSKVKKVTPEYVASIRAFNVEKTCTSQFEPLMRGYGLEVVHSFSDAITGANLVDITVTANDCAKRQKP